jgi:hypothetical protein
VSNEEKTGGTSSKDALLSLYSHKESNIAFAVFIALVLLLGTIQSLDWKNNYYQQAVDAKTANDWSIRFDVTTSSQDQTEVWQDKETKIIEFEMEDFGIPEGDYIGAVFVSITPKDSDASAVDPLVQCDAISADVEKNEFTAQWDYEGNNLSGQDSSCETIVMYLQVYPGYTGSEQTSDAPNEYQALMPWTASGWGEGTLEIKVELDVNSVDQLGPVSQDEDEEITVTVNIETFTAEAVMNS